MECKSFITILFINVCNDFRQIVGVITEFSTPRDAKSGPGKHSMKGHISTPGHNIPFIMWNDNIERHGQKLKVGHKFVIQNISCPALNTKYDRTSTVNFQATFIESTILIDLGMHDDATVATNLFTPCTLEEAADMDGLVGMFHFCY